MLKPCVDEAEAGDDSSDEEFVYPGAEEYVRSDEYRRATSRASSSNTDYFARSGSSSRAALPDLTPQLSQAPDFRVPTHEAPQKVTRWASPNPHQINRWEKDEEVSHCRDCQRRFTFLNRRVRRKSRPSTKYLIGCSITAVAADAYFVTGVQPTGFFLTHPTLSRTRHSLRRLQHPVPSVSA